jgi:16S rRNA (uracil1498-N3)-methyltransferase
VPSGRGPEEPTRAVAHVFVDDLRAPVLADEDRHHLERVLRVRPGERVDVSDGAGARRTCTFGRGGVLEPVGGVEVTARPAPSITIAFAITKGERPELTVQKLTELGVDRIVPFVAARSVVRWEGDRATRHVERLRRVARQAAMQSRRTRLPMVEDLVDFAGAAALPGATRADLDGSAPTLSAPTVIIGPEGGWSDAEREAPLPATSLAAHVLRAETAAITAAALLQAMRLALIESTSPYDPE